MLLGAGDGPAVMDTQGAGRWLGWKGGPLLASLSPTGRRAIHVVLGSLLVLLSRPVAKVGRKANAGG